MPQSPLQTIREVHASLNEWLAAARQFSDPAAQAPGTVQKISAQIDRVTSALREAPPELAASEEWKSESAAYAQTLGELRARLQNFELSLRIRRNHMASAKAHLRAARSWSELAKHIG